MNLSSSDVRAVWSLAIYSLVEFAVGLSGIIGYWFVSPSPSLLAYNIQNFTVFAASAICLPICCIYGLRSQHLVIRMVGIAAVIGLIGRVGFRLMGGA